MTVLLLFAWTRITKNNTKSANATLTKKEMVKERRNRAIKVLITYMAIITIIFFILLALIVCNGGIKGFT